MSKKKRERKKFRKIPVENEGNRKKAIRIKQTSDFLLAKG